MNCHRLVVSLRDCRRARNISIYKTDIVSTTKFFTNKDGNTLMKEFEGVIEHNPDIKNLDAIVGFLRASGYFTLRPFLNGINKVRILIGIDVDKYIAKAAKAGTIFFGAEDEVKRDYLNQLKQDIETAHYSKNVEDGIFQMIQDIKDGKLELRAHPSKKIHAKVYVLYPDGYNQYKMATAITGSSNLSGNGLGITEKKQYEFNVKLNDYDDVKFALDEFEALWSEAEGCPIESVDIEGTVVNTILHPLHCQSLFFQAVHLFIAKPFYCFSERISRSFLLACGRKAYQDSAFSEVSSGTRNTSIALAVFVTEKVTSSQPFCAYSFAVSSMTAAIFAGPTAASRSTMIVGKLVERAALEMKERWDEGDFSTEVEYEHPEGYPWDQATFRGDAYLGYGWGAVIVEVEVDKLTNEVKTLGVWSSHEIGKAIDELIVHGQINGGIMQSLGYGSMEKLENKGGYFRQKSMSDYVIPTSMDSAILACAMLLALTACGGDNAQGNAGSGAADGDTFKIGVIYPMSGGNAFFGNAMVDATKIAVDWVNENGGINGKQIVAIYGDGATASEASTEATRLIDSEGVNVILGSMSSGNANAIRSVTERSNTVLFETSAVALSSRNSSA